MAAVVAQAQAFENACERGGMIAVLAEPTLYDEPFLHEHSEMAGVNFDRHFAVSAGWHQLDAIDATLKQRGIAHQRLAVSYAFHSRWVDNARDEFMVSLRGIPQGSGTLPLACCAQAAILTQLPETFFWNVVRRFWRNHRFENVTTRQLLIALRNEAGSWVLPRYRKRFPSLF